MSLSFERLEERVLLSSVTINGTDASEEIRVEGTGEGSFDLFINDALIDSFEGVKNLKIDGKDGSDIIDVYNLQIEGKLEIKDGGGEFNVINVGAGGRGPSGSHIGKDLKIETKGSDDLITVGNFDVDIPLPDVSADSLGVGDLFIGGKLEIKAGHGNNVVAVGTVSESLLDGLPLGRDVSADPGYGAGSVSIVKDVKIETGNDNDLVAVVDARDGSAASYTILTSDVAAEVPLGGLNIGGNLQIKTNDGNDAAIVGTLGIDLVEIPDWSADIAALSSDTFISPAVAGQFNLAGDLSIDTGKMDDFAIVAAALVETPDIEVEFAATDGDVVESILANGVNIIGDLEVDTGDGDDFVLIGTGVFDFSMFELPEIATGDVAADDGPPLPIGGQMLIGGDVGIETGKGDDIVAVGAANVGVSAETHLGYTDTAAPEVLAPLAGLNIAGDLDINTDDGDDVVALATVGVGLDITYEADPFVFRDVAAAEDHAGPPPGLFNLFGDLTIETGKGTDVAIIAAVDLVADITFPIEPPEEVSADTVAAEHETISVFNIFGDVEIETGDQSDIVAIGALNVDFVGVFDLPDLFVGLLTTDTAAPDGPGHSVGLLNIGGDTTVDTGKDDDLIAISAVTADLTLGDLSVLRDSGGSGPQGTRIAGDLEIDSGDGNDLVIAAAIRAGVLLNVVEVETAAETAADEPEGPPPGLLHIGGNVDIDSGEGDDVVFVAAIGIGVSNVFADSPATDPGFGSDVTVGGKLAIRTRGGNDIVGVGGLEVMVFPESSCDTTHEVASAERTMGNASVTTGGQVHINTGNNDDLAVVGNIGPAIQAVIDALTGDDEPLDEVAADFGGHFGGYFGYVDWTYSVNPFSGYVEAGGGFDVQMRRGNDMTYFTNVQSSTWGVFNGGLGSNALFTDCYVVDHLVSDGALKVNSFDVYCLPSSPF